MTQHSVVRPGRSFPAAVRNARGLRALFAWSAADLSLTARTGQVGTLTRASAGGAVVDRNGRLRAPVHSQPRWQMVDLDGDGVRETPGLLLEAQRTNAVTYSQDVDNAAWTKGACTITPNAAIAPDGTLTADKVVEDATNNVRYVLRTIAGTTDNTLTAASVYVKAGERTWCALHSRLKAGGSVKTYFNLATGQWGTISGSHAVRATALADGWYRLEWACNFGTGATTPEAGINIVTGDGGLAYQGDGASGIYVWGLDIAVDQSFAASYVPTAGAAATRVRDVLAWSFAAPPQALTVYTKLVDLGTRYNVSDGGGSPRVFQIGKDDDTGYRLGVIASQGGNSYHGWYQGQAGTSQPDLVHSHAVGDVVELRAVLRRTGDFLLARSVNSGAEATSLASGGGALPPTWSDTRFALGSLSTAKGTGFAAFLSALVVTGEPSLADLRTLAA